MNERRLHTAISPDGTEIVGRVIGDGPPLVLVHGGLGDGELTWRAMLPLLTDHFTCYTMSTRGRGLSAAPTPPDFSLARIVEDVVAFAGSLDGPVRLAGYSSGGMYALGAAADCKAVSAVAVFEPPVLDATEEDARRFASAAARLEELVAQGRLGDAARTMVGIVALDEEMAALEGAGAFDEWSRNVPVGRAEVLAAARGEGQNPLDPESLARITAPVLYLYGSRGHRWYRDGARHLAGHVADLRAVEVDGVAHFAPLFTPEPLAEQLVRFLR